MAQHCADVFECWDSIRWHRIVLGGNTNAVAIPEAQEAFAENTVGGGMLREFGPGGERMIIWRAQGSNLWLAELDSKGEIQNNAIQIVFRSNIHELEGSVAIFDDESFEDALSVCVVTCHLDVFRFVFRPNVEGGSVFSSCNSCNNDSAAVSLLRSAPGSSFGVRLEFDPSTIGDTLRWISPYVLLTAMADSTVCAIQWASPLVRGSPPLPGECPPPVVTSLTESAGGGGGGLGALWSSFRTKSVNSALAFAPLPPHDAHNGGDRFVVSLHSDASLRIWDLSTHSSVSSPYSLPSSGRHQNQKSGDAEWLDLSSTGHTLRCFPHPTDKDKFVVFCSLCPKGRVRLEARPLLIVGRSTPANHGHDARPSLLTGAGHMHALKAPVLWAGDDVDGEAAEAATATELMDVMMNRAGECYVMWNADGRLPFAWDGVPAAYTPKHKEQVIYARSGVRVSIHTMRWCGRGEWDDSEELDSDSIGQGRQWLDNATMDPMMIEPSGSAGGLPASVAAKDSGALLRSRITYQEMQKSVMESLPKTGGVGIIPRLGLSLLHWFQKEVSDLERWMLSRFSQPGRFSDASLRRALRCGDGPLPFSHRRDVAPSVTGTALRTEVLLAAREWAAATIPEFRVLAGVTDSAAEDYDTLLSDPLALLTTLQGIWLCLLGGCERMMSSELAAVALLSAPYTDPRRGSRLPAPYLPISSPILLLSNRFCLLNRMQSSTERSLIVRSTDEIDSLLTEEADDDGMELEVQSSASTIYVVEMAKMIAHEEPDLLRRADVVVRESLSGSFVAGDIIAEMSDMLKAAKSERLLKSNALGLLTDRDSLRERLLSKAKVLLFIDQAPSLEVLLSELWPPTSTSSSPDLDDDDMRFGTISIEASLSMLQDVVSWRYNQSRNLLLLLLNVWEGGGSNSILARKHLRKFMLKFELACRFYSLMIHLSQQRVATHRGNNDLGAMPVVAVGCGALPGYDDDDMTESNAIVSNHLNGFSRNDPGSLLFAFATMITPCLKHHVASSLHDAGSSLVEKLMVGIMNACAPRFPGLGSRALNLRSDGSGRCCSLLSTWLERTGQYRVMNLVNDYALSALINIDCYVSECVVDVTSAIEEHYAIQGLALLSEARKLRATQSWGSHANPKLLKQEVVLFKQSAILLSKAAPFGTMLCSERSANASLGEDVEDTQIVNIDNNALRRLFGQGPLESFHELTAVWRDGQFPPNELKEALLCRGALLSLQAVNPRATALFLRVELPRLLSEQEMNSNESLWPLAFANKTFQNSVFSLARVCYFDAVGDVMRCSSEAIEGADPETAKSLVEEALKLVRLALDSFHLASHTVQYAVKQIALALHSRAFLLLLELGRFQDAFAEIVLLNSDGKTYLMKSSAQTDHLKHLVRAVCESGRVDELINMPFDIHSLSQAPGNSDMISLVSSFLTDQSVECLHLYASEEEESNNTFEKTRGLGALEWDRVRYAFHASRKLWDKCALDMLKLAMRIEVQDPEAVSLLLNVQLACLNSLRLCPENRRYLITKPMKLLPHQNSKEEVKQEEELEVITLRCLHFRIASTMAKAKLGGAYRNPSVEGRTISSWSDEVAAAEMTQTLVQLLVSEGYFDYAISLVVAFMKFDVASVGVGMGAERKKQARVELMAFGEVSSELSNNEAEHVSLIAKRLLCDIVESLARLAVKFSTCEQPGSLVSCSFADLKLRLSGCRWAWHEPTRTQSLPTEFDTTEDSAVRCLAQTRSSEAFSFLRHVLELHDKASWNCELRSAAVYGCLSEDDRVALPCWLTAGFTADHDTNPRGLPTAAYRPLRRSALDEDSSTPPISSSPSRSSPSSSTSSTTKKKKKPADPTALLRLYISKGMLEKGCELVRNVFVGSAGLATAIVGEEPQHGSFGCGRVKGIRQRNAGTVNEVFLPELGDSVYIPYHHIDELLELCYLRLNSHDMAPPPQQLQQKVYLLEEAMQEHFEKLLIRECFIDHTRRVAKGQVRL